MDNTPIDELDLTGQTPNVEETVVSPINADAVTSPNESKESSILNLEQSDVSSKEKIASNINQGEGSSPGTTERTTEETASVTTSSPEVSKPVVIPPSTNININLEKEKPTPIGEKLESILPTSQLNLSGNQTSVSNLFQNTTESNTTSQQTINSPSSTVNQSNTNSTATPTTNTSESTTSSSTTLNQAKSGERPKLKDKLKQVAGNVVNSDFVKNLGETAKESLKVAAARAPVLNSILERVEEKRDRESKEYSQVNSSTTTTSNPSVTSANNQANNTIVNSSESVTTNQPTANVPQNMTESKVEKSNPTMVGNTSIIAPEQKKETSTVQTPTQTPSSPTISEVKTEPSPKPQVQPNQTAQESPQIFMDVASLENRLKRIEQALTNPLEVIIKET